LAPAGDYRVLSTDYSSYAVVYSCDESIFGKTEYAWILTRERNPKDSLLYKGIQVLKDKVPNYDIS
jgi:apolipoprotein D and lipocalin family protein